MGVQINHFFFSHYPIHLMKRLVPILAAFACGIFLAACSDSSMPTSHHDNVVAQSSTYVPAPVSTTDIGAPSKSGGASTQALTQSIAVKGKIYYVDVVHVGTAIDEVWLRTLPYACSPTDIKYMRLTGQKSSINNALKQICTLKQYYDNGKTVIGCVGTLGAVVCASASVPTGGAAAAVCGVTIVYTVNGGFSDCISGIADYIGGKVVGETDFQQDAMYAAISTGQFKIAIDHAINVACSTIK